MPREPRHAAYRRRPLPGEVVDPKTEPVPDGEEGELVLTPLGKHAIPVLRAIHTTSRMSSRKVRVRSHHGAHAEVRSRCDDMLIIQ